MSCNFPIDWKNRIATYAKGSFLESWPGRFFIQLENYNSYDLVTNSSNSVKTNIEEKIVKVASSNNWYKIVATSILNLVAAFKFKSLFHFVKFMHLSDLPIKNIFFCLAVNYEKWLFFSSVDLEKVIFYRFNSSSVDWLQVQITFYTSIKPNWSAEFQQSLFCLHSFFV